MVGVEGAVTEEKEMSMRAEKDGVGEGHWCGAGEGAGEGIQIWGGERGAIEVAANAVAISAEDGT